MPVDFIHPSRPTARPVAARDLIMPVTLYKPSHRRAVPADSDPTSHCISPFRLWCIMPFCPRHRPDSYADAMARHATGPVLPWASNQQWSSTGCEHAAELIESGVRGYGPTGDYCAECWF